MERGTVACGRSSYYLQEHPARCFDPLSRHPSRLFRTEEGYHSPNIIRLPYPAKRRLRGHVPDQLRIVLESRLGKIRFNDSRRHNVRRDPPSSQFLGQVFRQYLDSAFHRGISSITRGGKPGQTAGNIDDTPLVRQARQCLLREEIYPFAMYLSPAVASFFRRLLEKRRCVAPGITNEETNMQPFRYLLQGH